MAYACRILADSISPAGHRLTSFEVTFPRIVLAEFNTHCMLSRNSASSRAIPVAKRIDAVETDPFVPESFGRNQKGMQPGEPLDSKDAAAAQLDWLDARDECILRASSLASRGVHKQYANRLLEPFSWHTAVITATEWDNFEHLRCNPMAQGEFQKAAQLMMAARTNSEPRALNCNEWHLPYVEPDAEVFTLNSVGLDPWKVSVGRCARVSYLTQNGVRDPAEDVALADRLLENAHMSPFEHVARPMTDTELAITRSFDVAVSDGPILRYGCPPSIPAPRVCGAACDDPSKNHISFVRGPLHYSGKLNGWISRRAFVHGEHDILGYRSQVHG